MAKAQSRKKPSAGKLQAAERGRKREVLKQAIKLNETERYEEAVALLKAHVEDLGGLPVYDELLGICLHRADRNLEAVRYLRNAIAKQPTALRFTYLANCFHIMGDFDEALRCHQAAFKLDPGNWKVLYNFGYTLEYLGRYTEAVEALEIARKVQGNDPLLLHQLGKYYLIVGNIEMGSQLIDAGLGCNKRTPPAGLKGPYWRGEDLTGKRLLVWQEEGIGDEIRNASLYPDLIARGGQLIIECRHRLAGLFARSFPEAIIEPQDEPPQPYRRKPFDYHCGQQSVLQFVRTQAEQFPVPGPYLKPDPALVEKWRGRLARLGQRPCVGISWTSGLLTQARGHMLWRPELIADLLRTPDVAFINILYSSSAEETRALNETMGTNLIWFDDIDLRNDMENAFALTAALDLVISAPTSTLDIAGAVGTPILAFYPPAAITMLGLRRHAYYQKMEIVERVPREPWEGSALEMGRRFKAWLARYRGDQPAAASG